MKLTLFLSVMTCFCSEPDDVRLLGGASRVAGTLKMKQKEVLKPVNNYEWTLQSAALVCRPRKKGFCSLVLPEKDLEGAHLTFRWILQQPYNHPPAQDFHRTK